MRAQMPQPPPHQRYRQAAFVDKATAPGTRQKCTFQLPSDAPKMTPPEPPSSNFFHKPLALPAGVWYKQ